MSILNQNISYFIENHFSIKNNERNAQLSTKNNIVLFSYKAYQNLTIRNQLHFFIFDSENLNTKFQIFFYTAIRQSSLREVKELFR